ncbi:glycosyltransferase [Pseudoponticoccus marisrubri]|uniref:Glucosaminyltransferase n=1 Tax=Pseudoponticoccus marisrubri TaxID=1685382 RepID=A0A0W7WMN6_9RHOB|nr:glycosyltransferase [Pseudoponticoccus marisrubri]KUF11830.1 glucosaminyltransferase [Pseudoponticoccus marisrubri]
MTAAPAPEGTTGQQGRNDVRFWSVDSAPRRFASKVPQHAAPLTLALFSVIAFALLWAVNEIPALDALFPHNDLVFAPAQGSHAVAVRIFVISFLSAFALTCDRSILRRAQVLLDMVGSYVALCLLMDLMAHLLLWQTHIVLSLHVIEIASGLTGFAVFAFKLLERGEMPARIRLRINTRKTRSVALRLIVVTLVAAGIAWYVASLNLWLEQALRHLTLLGGIGPGVFLFLPTFFTLLYLGARVEAHLAPLADFSPDLTIFVPAHNEEYIIADTIRAMDVAATRYDGHVELLVMNNNSSDRTAEVAAAALAACTALSGRVIDVPKPGKANALNAGLDAVETEYCVRVDADTQLGPDSLRLAMRHFADPQVGVVGGVPLPPGGGLFDRARFLEVAVKHAFYSVAFGTIDSVVGIPGMFSVYRTELPRDLGGFVEGMNGEDTDISLRAGELGYRLVVDPKVRYISEVPATYRHMREQRTRWFRSTFHISARCRDLIFSRHGTVRGKIILPYMLINSARRAMMVPLLLFGAIEYLTSFNAFNTLMWQSVVALTVGAPALMAMLCALLMRRPGAILYLPEYLLFRVMRAYFTLESMLSINIRAYGEHPYSRSALARPAPPSVRIA